MSGVTLTYGIVKRRESQILKARIQELSLHLRRYERLLENIREVEKHREKQINIDAMILELYAKGYSLRQIARKVGLSHTTVSRRLKKLLGETGNIPSSSSREKVALEV